MAFFAVYACMLVSSVFARSASLSAAAGGSCVLGGIVAGQRDALAALLDPGLGRGLVLALTAPLPRVSELADAAAAIAVGLPPPESLGRVVLGTLVFGLAVLSVGAWRLEGKDF